jgi:hypothetical protein
MLMKSFISEYDMPVLHDNNCFSWFSKKEISVKKKNVRTRR